MPRSTIAFVLLLLALQMPAAELHVETDAAPGGDGSAAKPYASIQAAAEQAGPGDVVVIHAGIYRETVVPQRSGRVDAPIVYRSAGDGRVLISGADPIGPWTRIGSSPVWQAAYPEPFESSLNQHEQLFQDEEMLWTARTPSKPVGRGLFHPDTYLSISRVISISDVSQGASTPWGPVANGYARRITFECDELTDPAERWPEGSTLGLLPRQHLSWGFIIIGPVESYADGRITAVVFTDIKTNGDAFSRVTSGTEFFLTRGDGGELDAPGEWYHERTRGLVRVRLPDDGDPNRHAMSIKRRDYAVDLSERSHIILKDLEIHAATITTDNQLGDGFGMGAWLTHNRGSVGTAAQGNATAHHITLDGLRARHLNHFLGNWGSYHKQWIQSSGFMIAGSHHLVTACRIGATAGNGIVLFGTDHRITGNLIHDVNYSGVLASGIYIAETPSNTPGPAVKPDRIEIDHNTLVAGGWGLIDGDNLYTTDPGRPSRIHHNRIDGAGLLTRDVGGIRFVGHTVDNPLRTGPTRIDHNIVRNVVAALGSPIYFDFCDDYVTDHNLIYDCSGGINVNDGNNLTITNNTMFGFNSGVVAVLGKPFSLKDSLVRNNIASAGFITPSTKTGPGYVSDHNLANAQRSLFIDPANGDYRLRVDASAAIDMGSTGVPHLGSTTAAPDLGAFERGHDDWAQDVGLQTAFQQRPDGLVARARSDGTVDITWNDRNAGLARYVIDRGYRIDHPNGGWEFLTVATVEPGVTRFVDQVQAGPVSHYYRVRAEYSDYSPWAITAAGILHSDTITFGSEQGYENGPLLGQGPWAVDPYNSNGRDSTVVVDGSAEIRGNESLLVLGDYGMIDPSFDDAASSVRFSLRMRLKQVSASDAKACAIYVGGVNIYQKNTHAFELGLRRDGYLYASTATGWKGIGKVTDFAASATDWVTIAGTLDYARREIVALSVNGITRTVNWSFYPYHADLHDGLWHIKGEVVSAAAAVQLDDLRFRIDDRPIVWLTALTRDLKEGGAAGMLRLACDRPLEQDLTISMELDAGSQADVDDIQVLDAWSIPAGQTHQDIAIQALHDGIGEGQEALIWHLRTQAAYRIDPDPVKTTAELRISDAAGPVITRQLGLRIQPLTLPVLLRLLGSNQVQEHDGSTLSVFTLPDNGSDQRFIIEEVPQASF